MWRKKVSRFVIILCPAILFIVSCGSGVGQSGNSNQNKTDNVYQICGQLPYADDYLIDLMIRTTQRAREAGAGDLETLSALADPCDQSCVEPDCDPPTCNECMVAIVDLVYDW